jgi:formamidopyrimidine-DNA glycosylase
MPELPEVETVARGLRAVLPGKCILSVRLGKTDFIDDPAAVERELPGCRIAAVRRFGKFLLLDLERSTGDVGQFSLQIHLGMTGQIVTCQPEAHIAAHTHMFFALDDGRELRYTDIRRFGRVRILANGAREDVLGEFGLDPLEASEEEFRASIRSRRARIKALFLDQHVLRGIGNIYTDESLWRARIHPMRLGEKLKDHELHLLFRAIQQVLREAIRLRGSSVSDYVDSNGESGEFQLRHRVYMREGKKCFRCSAVIRRVIVAGRSSYFCPRCQVVPRQARKRTKAKSR